MTFRPDAGDRGWSPERRQVEELGAELAALVDEVRHGPVLDIETGRRSPVGAAELLMRARIRSHDGYRRSSGPAGMGGRSATDRHGERLPDYSDSVGELVAAEVVDSQLVAFRETLAAVSVGTGCMEITTPTPYLRELLGVGLREGGRRRRLQARKDRPLPPSPALEP